MLRKIISLLLCVLIVIPVTLSAYAVEDTDGFSERLITCREDNIEGNHYEYINCVNRSFFTTVAEGYMRLYGADNGTVFVEYYNADFRCINSGVIPSGLPIFGGFYEDGDRYYVLTGQTNFDESPDVEVYRLTKFDHNWNELGHASVKNANTTIPFQGGCDFASYRNHLIVRTGRQMYSYQGQYHQANITLRFDTNTMREEQSVYTAGQLGEAGYISHSFNQFVAVDQENGTVVCLDHGDAYPRASVLGKFRDPADTDFIVEGRMRYTGFPIVAFEYGAPGDNVTGANVGGLEISSTSYLTVGSVISENGDYLMNESRNAYLTVTGKSDFTAENTRLIPLSSFKKEDYKCATNPHLVKINNDRFLVMWDERNSGRLVSGGGKVIYDSPGSPTRMKYVFIDGEGNFLTDIMTAPEDKQIFVSGAEPCVDGDRIIWFYSNEDEIDTAAEMDLEGNITLHEHIIPQNVLTYPIDMNLTDTVLKTFDPIPESLELNADNILDYVGVYKDGYELTCGEDFNFSSKADAPFTAEYQDGYLKRIGLNLETMHGRSYVGICGIGSEFRPQPFECGAEVYTAFDSHRGDIPTWTDDGVRLCYTFTRGAGYHIYRKEAGGEYEKIASFGGRGGNVYCDTTAQRGKRYRYTAREYSFDKDGNEILSDPLIAKTPDTPEISVQTTFDGVHLSWDAMDGAEKYAVFKYDIDKEKVVYPALGLTTECQFDLRDLGYDVKKRYAVAVVDSQQEQLNITDDRRYSPFGLSPTVTLNNVPAITRYECRSDGLYIEWATNEFADYYCLWGTNIKTTDNHLLLRDIVNHQKYYLSVYAYRKDSPDPVYAPSRTDWEKEVVFVAPGTDEWEFIEGFTDDYGATTITGWRGSGSSVEVPGDLLGTQEVYLDKTFRNNTRLRKVTLPDNTTGLWNVFEGCTALQSITIPASVTYIYDRCFAGCTSLKSVVFDRDNDIYSIPSNSFEGCTDVTFYGYGEDNAAYRFAQENGYRYVDLDQILIGDADGDSKVSIIDATFIQRVLASIAVPSSCDEKAADVDCSGGMTIIDVTYIQRYLAGMEVPYPVGTI